MFDTDQRMVQPDPEGRTHDTHEATDHSADRPPPTREADCENRGIEGGATGVAHRTNRRRRSGDRAGDGGPGRCGARRGDRRRPRDPDRARHARRHTVARGRAVISGWSAVIERATVDGDAWVFGRAAVRGDASIAGHAQVFGDATVGGGAVVDGNVGPRQRDGHRRRLGDRTGPDGDAIICGTATISGSLRIGGHTVIGNGAEITCHTDYETHQTSWGRPSPSTAATTAVLGSAAARRCTAQSLSAASTCRTPDSALASTTLRELWGAGTALALADD